MKKITILSIFVLSFALLTGCFSDDGETTDDPIVADEGVMKDYTSETITIDGTATKAWKLDQFVSKTEVNKFLGLADTYDGRQLFAAVTYGSDGYSNRTKPKADLRWDQFITGYLLPKANDAKTYYPAFVAASVNTYNIKNAATVKLYLKLDFVRADGTYVTVEAKSLTTTTISVYKTVTGATLPYDVSELTADGTLDVVKLGDIITNYVSTDTASTTFAINTADAYGEVSGITMADNINGAVDSGKSVAYYCPKGAADNIPAIRFTKIYNIGGTEYIVKQGGSSTIKYPTKVTLTGGTTGTPAGTLTNAATADLTFSYPVQ